VEGTSGTTTTSLPQSAAASTFEELTESTSSAPARVAAATSVGSKESIETRSPASTSSRTTSPTSRQPPPGSQPRSIRSAPSAAIRSASRQIASRESRGAWLISARISILWAP